MAIMEKTLHGSGGTDVGQRLFMGGTRKIFTALLNVGNILFLPLGVTKQGSIRTAVHRRRRGGYLP